MEKQTPSRRRHRILALIFLISFLLSCGLTWWLHTPSGHAAGFYLEKTRYRLFSPYYLPDPDGDGRSDVFGIRISDEKDLAQAKTLMPELLVPGYIPEGWEMERLEVTKKLQGNRYAELILVSEKETEQLITIEELYETEKEDILFYHDVTKIDLNGKTVYQCTDPMTGLYSIVFYSEGLMVTIGGVDKDTVLSIADTISND